MKPAKIDRINKLTDRLLGSTENMEDLCDDLELDPMDEEVTSAVDAVVFCCTECNWWCESSEESSAYVGAGDLICIQCAEENHGYEES